MVTLLAFAATCAIVASLGCGGDNRNCADSSDCFAGEVCNADLVCVERPPPGANNAGNSDGGSDGGSGTDGGTGNNGRQDGGPGTDGGPNNPNDDAGPQPGDSECVVDRFDYVCEEDDWEPNDGYDPVNPNWDHTPWAADSWCVSSGSLVNVSRSVEGTLCPGDPGDAFRFLVSHPCQFDNQVKFTITVTLHTECDANLFRVEPYTIGRDPIRNDLCADDENVRCTVSADGRVHTIDWIFPEELSYDPRVQIMAESDNIQFDYTVEFTITP